MASDQVLREGVRENMKLWIQKLECGGDVEKQHNFKKKFISRLRNSVIAESTDKANEQHYEVPTDFFLTVLGNRLKYSSCYWPDGVTSLEEAEDATLQKYCELANLEDGQRIMDLGCGWGSLGLYVCEKFPQCQVTCISNSNTQRQFIESRAQQLGFSGRLTVITADANTFCTDIKYDRIFSIEMFEHMKNYQLLFQRVASWLLPSGFLFLQVFCHRQHPYSFDVKPGSDTEWMAKNFFTGGTMPSMDLFLYFQKDLSIVDSWVLNGQHYSKTLEAWLQRMDSNMDKVMEIFNKTYGSDAEKQKFNWRFFFIFCSEVFGHKGGNEWHISWQLFSKNVLSSL